MWQAAGKRFLQRNASLLRQLKAQRRLQRARAGNKVRCATSQQRDLQHLDTFYRAMRPYLCLAQLFGIMPLANVLSHDPQAVVFKLRSVGMCFSVLFLLLGGVKTLRIAGQMYQGARNMITMIFYSSGLVICLSFIFVARSWARIIVPWNAIDIIMLYPPYAPTKRTLRRKLFTTGWIMVVVTLVEHFLYYASSYYNYLMRIEHCQVNVTSDPFSSYMQVEFADIFDKLPYNPIVIFYAFFLNATFKFITNFMDTFIILVSIGLSQRFRQFAMRVLRLENRHVSDALWHELRMHHILLCDLMELVDSKLSHIVLLSCLNNIYFICNQLLAIFIRLRYPINYAYFWFSLLFLLSRTCAVFICASRIHDYSALPLKVLYMVPSDRWTEEVQRFTHQLNSQYIGLSGFRLYYLTKRSLFGMMSTLVYYEFMLLQLNARSYKGELTDLCV